MIPDHLIDKAAANIYRATVFGDEFAIDAWHDMDDDNPMKTTTRMFARAALEAVAHIIWNQGWEAGMSYVISLERGIDDDENVSNPYERIENA